MTQILQIYVDLILKFRLMEIKKDTNWYPYIFYLTIVFRFQLSNAIINYLFRIAHVYQYTATVLAGDDTALRADLRLTLWWYFSVASAA